MSTWMQIHSVSIVDYPDAPPAVRVPVRDDSHEAQYVTRTLLSFLLQGKFLPLPSICTTRTRPIRRYLDI